MKLLSGILIGLAAAIAMMSFSITRQPILDTISHATRQVDQVKNEANDKLARLVKDAIEQQSRTGSPGAWTPVEVQGEIASLRIATPALSDQEPYAKPSSTTDQLSSNISPQAILPQNTLSDEIQPVEARLEEAQSAEAQSEITAIERPVIVDESTLNLTPGDSMVPRPGTAPYLFQVAWTPFRSEASAAGFAAKLENQLDQAFRIIKAGPGQYEVGFEFTTDQDRASVLEAIARLTGFQSPNPPRIVE